MNKSKTKKKIIDKYILPIFTPNELVVCKNVTSKDINKIYSYYDNSDIDMCEDYNACVYYDVMERTTRKKVMLCILDISEDSIKDEGKVYIVGVCAHEALHIAFRTLNHCGIKLDNSTNETFAYLVEWITKCILKTQLK